MSTGRLLISMLGTWTFLLAACGSDASSSGADGDWRAQHGASLDNLGRELDVADDALDGGERDAILGACNLLNDALAVVRDNALPVPDPQVHRALSEALVDIGFAVRSCLVGGRSAVAIDVEAAMAVMDEARRSFDRAQAALAAWNSTSGGPDPR